MNANAKKKAAFRVRVELWVKKLDAPVRALAVRSMSRKWASYSTAGRLTFDTTILELRDELQDYIIVHELLHFHAPNHGRLWKSLMRAHLGNYESLESELRTSGAVHTDAETREFSSIRSR